VRVEAIDGSVGYLRSSSYPEELNELKIRIKVLIKTG